MPSDSVAAEREVVREGVAMAFYISLSLLAIMIALPQDIAATGRTALVLLLIFDTLGLLAAHWLAFRAAAHVAYRDVFSHHQLKLLGAQVAGGALAGVVAILPVLLVDPTVALLASEFFLAGLILVVGFLTARASGASPRRALLYIVLVDAAAIVLLLGRAFLIS